MSAGHASWVEFLDQELQLLVQAGLERKICSLGDTISSANNEATSRPVVDFGTNDYLDLAHNIALTTSSINAVDRYGVGTGSSRVLSGSSVVHDLLEIKLAEFLGAESTLVLGAGYLANLALFSALLNRFDTVIADKLCHASLIDGITGSRSKHLRYRHNCCDDLRRLLEQHSQSVRRGGKIVVVTESLFSMDGDYAPLQEICELCLEFGALLVVDEAHAVGVLQGGVGGLPEQYRRAPWVIRTGSFSKAFGSYGGFIACSEKLRRLLISKARPFLFQTSLPVCIVAASLAAVETVVESPKLGEKLLERASEFRKAVTRAGLMAIPGQSQIVPILVPAGRPIRFLVSELKSARMYVPYIRPPTVPKGTERFRVSLSLAQCVTDLGPLIEILARHLGSNFNEVGFAKTPGEDGGF